MRLPAGSVSAGEDIFVPSNNVPVAASVPCACCGGSKKPCLVIYCKVVCIGIAADSCQPNAAVHCGTYPPTCCALRRGNRRAAEKLSKEDNKISNTCRVRSTVKINRGTKKSETLGKTAALKTAAPKDARRSDLKVPPPGWVGGVVH